MSNNDDNSFPIFFPEHLFNPPKSFMSNTYSPRKIIQQKNKLTQLQTPSRTHNTYKSTMVFNMSRQK